MGKMWQCGKLWAWGNKKSEIAKTQQSVCIDNICWWGLPNELFM